MISLLIWMISLFIVPFVLEIAPKGITIVSFIHIFNVFIGGKPKSSLLEHFRRQGTSNLALLCSIYYTCP